MTYVSLIEAERATGFPRDYIYRHIHAGNVAHTYQADDRGVPRYLISLDDVKNLPGVQPAKPKRSTTNTDHLSTSARQVRTIVELRAEAQLAGLTLDEFLREIQ